MYWQDVVNLFPFAAIVPVASWLGPLLFFLGSGNFSSQICRADEGQLQGICRVRTAPGLGRGVTVKDLAARWAAMPEQADVVSFYGESDIWGCFSNFYSDGHDFSFVIPQEFFARGMRAEDARTVKCAFSEKAIMLCKAAVMGDEETFVQIEAAATPEEAKKLGRAIKGFNQAVWDEVVCSVAFEVIFQKFQKVPELREVLLMTGDAIIVEASRWDGIWGIKLDVKDPRVRSPAQWQGTNILGWALMEARAALRG